MNLFAIAFAECRQLDAYTGKSVLLSILVPVYNERTVVERSLRRVFEAPLPADLEREVIIVDDCSKDGTYAILERLAEEEPRIRLYRHEVNQGKGAAIRSALHHAIGDFCLVQDADLEYDPFDYTKLLAPLVDGNADAVFGSRYLPAAQTRILPFWHSLINKTLTLISNMFCNLALTDMETCYKVFRTDLLKSIPIRSDRFGFEPEITMKSAKRKLRIYEVPVSYHGRTYEEGKKIGWKDGINALGVILRFWLIDDLYVGRYGRGFLNNLTGTPQYVRWICDVIRPYLGDYVLEIGAGIGNFSGRLMSRRFSYLATESDELYLHALQNRFLKTPNVVVQRLRPTVETDFENLPSTLDTVLCINVLELIRTTRICCAASTLLCPRVVGLFCWFPAGCICLAALTQLWATSAGIAFPVLELFFGKTVFSSKNFIRSTEWELRSGISPAGLSGPNAFSKLFLKLFDKTIWLWRLLDHLIPWQGVSMIAVSTRQSGGSVGQNVAKILWRQSQTS